MNRLIYKPKEIKILKVILRKSAKVFWELYSFWCFARHFPFHEFWNGLPDRFVFFITSTMQLFFLRWLIFFVILMNFTLSWYLWYVRLLVFWRYRWWQSFCLWYHLQAQLAVRFLQTQFFFFSINSIQFPNFVLVSLVV